MMSPAYGERFAKASVALGPIVKHLTPGQGSYQRNQTTFPCSVEV